MQTVLITGGTGMVGQSLSNFLIAKGYQVIVLTRQQKQSSRANFSFAKWDLNKAWIDPAAIAAADYIIHLAGEGVADKRWTAARKKAILDSRVDSSALLVKALKEHPKTSVFLLRLQQKQVLTGLRGNSTLNVVILG